MIGPIKGEINIAPIITAVEFTFKPNEAINMAQMSIQRLAPLKVNSIRYLCNNIYFAVFVR